VGYVPPFLPAYTRVVPKLMTPIILCWPTTSEADVGNVAVEVEPSRQYFLNFVAVQQMTAEGQSDKLISNMEVRMKRKGV